MAYQNISHRVSKKYLARSRTNFIGAKPVLEDLYRFLDEQNKSGLEEAAGENGDGVDV